jgi:hypothetical protein
MDGCEVNVVQDQAARFAEEIAVALLALTARLQPAEASVVKCLPLLT